MAKSKIKILIVEDEEFLLDLFHIKFEQAGFEVLKAENGEAGLSLAKMELPDLILLDILMPQVDGYDMLRKIKTDGETKKIPVIIFSNLSQKEEIEKGLKLGAKDFIIKTSVTPAEMVAKVKEFLKNNQI